MNNRQSYFFEINPRSAPRPRANYKSATHFEWYKDYMKNIAESAKNQIDRLGYEMFPKESFLIGSFLFFLEDNRWRDVNNLIKGVEDALIGIVYPDDKQIVGYEPIFLPITYKMPTMNPRENHLAKIDQAVVYGSIFPRIYFHVRECIPTNTEELDRILL